MKNLHITINNFSDTSITTSQWPIRGEPQRVGVKMGNKEYVIVLGAIPHFEVWSLDKQGELLDMEKTISSGESIGLAFLPKIFEEALKNPNARVSQSYSDNCSCDGIFERLYNLEIDES